MNFAVLLAAMVAVESGGNPHAIGDGGRARGMLQIHKGVVEDVNRFAGTSFSHRDAHRPEVARWIAATYLSHYATEDRIGHPPTAEDMARCWNGGPTGFKERSTLRYWRRVQSQLNKSRK